MNNKDYILIETTRPELVEKMIYEYFEDEYITHNGVDIELSQHNKKNEILISFLNILDNELFVFFFTSLSINIEFQKDNYKGWFNASDKISSKYDGSDFGGKLENDLFSKRIMLTTEMTEDYTVGFSQKDERIKFYYSGKFETNNSKGFKTENLKKDEFRKIKAIRIEKQRSKLNKSTGCGLLFIGIIILMTINIIYAT